MPLHVARMSKGKCFSTSRVNAGSGILALLVAMQFAAVPRSTAGATSSIPIQNFIFIIQENHSFDNYFGTFPGANGIPPGTALPDYPGGPLVEHPFLGAPSVHDMSHTWVSVQLAYDNGAMDGFFWSEWPAAAAYYGRDIATPKPNPKLVRFKHGGDDDEDDYDDDYDDDHEPVVSSKDSTSASRVDSDDDDEKEVLSPNGFADDEDPDDPTRGERSGDVTTKIRKTPPPLKRRQIWVKNTFTYLDYSVIPNYWKYAEKFTLCDNFFSAVEGPSLPNHLYAIAAQSGNLAFNPKGLGPPEFFFPCALDLLVQGGVSWKYYNGYRNPYGDTVWNPLPGFSTYEKRENKLEVKPYLAPTDQFYTDLRNGTLPQVSYLIPSAENSEHPPFDVRVGMWYVTHLVNAVMQSSYWNHCAIIVVWDDFGGFYDHVAPPHQADGLGDGFRVPALVISPYSNVGVVSTQYDLASLLKLLETAFDLPSLTPRDGSSNTMLQCFNFSQKPLPPVIINEDTKLDFSDLVTIKP
jgi:phospholipase C